MLRMMSRLWREAEGGLLSAEYLMLGTLLTLGLLVGISAVQSAMLTKLGELAAIVAGP